MRSYCLKLIMAALQSRFFVEENSCMRCFDNTKYLCLRCGQPICNKCSIFELNEETIGWIAGKSVGYCNDCHESQQGAKAKDKKQSSNYDTEDLEAGQNSPINPGSNGIKDADYHESEPGTDDDELVEEQRKSARKSKKKVGRRSSGSEAHLDDFVDIIISNEYYKKKLIFENTKKQKNGQIYERILKQLQERCKERGEEVPFSVIQLRSKFKKCVGECKWALMTIKTATGVDNFLANKGYGAWFNQLYGVVKARDSCQPQQAVEPSALTPCTAGRSLTPDHEDIHVSESPANGGTSTEETVTKQFVPVKNKKRRNKEDPVLEAVKMMKAVVENDPTKDLVKMLQDEMTKSHQHEMDMMTMILSAGNQGNPQPSPMPNNMTTMQPAHYHPHSYTQDLGMLQGHRDWGYQFQPISSRAVCRPSSASSSFTDSSSSSEQGEHPMYHTM